MEDEKIAILVPTRSRPEIFARLWESWKNTTSGKSMVIPIIDLDQEAEYAELCIKYNAGAVICDHHDNGTSLVAKLNASATTLSHEHLIISFIGDDCVFHTQGWEDRIIEWQEKNKGICYCNDQLQEGNLPNNVFIHSEFIEALGFMAPPSLNHYYIDNYWMDLGLRLRKIKYFHDVVIEHRHWSNNKASKDETYQSAEEKYMAKDKATWDAYRAPGGGLETDVSKIIKHQNL